MNENDCTEVADNLLATWIDNRYSLNDKIIGEAQAEAADLGLPPPILTLRQKPVEDTFLVDGRTTVVIPEIHFWEQSGAVMAMVRAEPMEYRCQSSQTIALSPCGIAELARKAVDTWVERGTPCCEGELVNDNYQTKVYAHDVYSLRPKVTVESLNRIEMYTLRAEPVGFRLECLGHWHRE